MTRAGKKEDWQKKVLNVSSSWMGARVARFFSGILTKKPNKYTKQPYVPKLYQISVK
jgi:hypothetical protein